jgi:hypothetical protein
MDERLTGSSLGANRLVSAIRIAFLLCLISFVLWVAFSISSFFTYSIFPSSMNANNLSLFPVLFSSNIFASFMFGIVGIGVGKTAKKRGDLQNNAYFKWLLWIAWADVVIPVVWVGSSFLFWITLWMPA